MPAPRVELTSTRPPISVARCQTVARPKPVPWPTGFVVYEGPKMRSRTSDAMPVPLSRQVNLIQADGLGLVESRGGALAGRAVASTRIRGLHSTHDGPASLSTRVSRAFSRTLRRICGTAPQCR